jgi:hypothetical protein
VCTTPAGAPVVAAEHGCAGCARWRVAASARTTRLRRRSAPPPASRAQRGARRSAAASNSHGAGALATASRLVQIDRCGRLGGARRRSTIDGAYAPALGCRSSSPRPARGRASRPACRQTSAVTTHVSPLSDRSGPPRRRLSMAADE